MTDFLTLLNDVLVEKGISIKDLESEGIIPNHSFYQYKTQWPYLHNAIKIANYLEVSLDYLLDRTSNNSFKKYKKDQNNFYKNLISILKQNQISQAKLSKEMSIGRANFWYWKVGKSPKLITLNDLANYLACNIDDFLDKE